MPSRPILLILALALAGIVTGWWFRVRNSELTQETGALDLPPALLEQDTSSLEPTGQISDLTNSAVALAEPNNVAATSANGALEKHPEVFDFNRLDDPAYAARVRRHVLLKNYGRSPAKETPECGEVVSLLARHGAGIEAVAECYNAAWEIHLQEQRLAEAPPGERAHHEIVLQMLTGEITQRLPNKFGITESQFIPELLRIKPRVFFGRFDPSIGDGEIIVE